MIFVRDIQGAVRPWNPAESEAIKVCDPATETSFASIDLGGNCLAMYEPDIAAIMFDIFMDFVAAVIDDRKNTVFTFPDMFFYTRYTPTLFPDAGEVREAYNKWKEGK